MADRIRYRLYAPRRARSSLAEWGPFLLALIVGACLLFMLARQSPVFTVPATLQAPRAPHQADHASALPQQPSPDRPD
jgi:hypothetical protein